MKRTTLRRSSGIAAVALTLSMGLAACSSDDSGDTAADSNTTSAAPTEETSPSESASEETTTDAGADTFGPGCASIPAEGAGSFNGMATEPVATAASGNPLLKTLVAAVGQAGLVDTLNGLPAATVFAPTDDAFAKIPAKTLNSVLKDKKTLTDILTYHVLPEQLDPTAVVGEQTTVQGGTVEVAGDESAMTVNDANVLCGNIPTANATVYVIDTVLMPS